MKKWNGLMLTVLMMSFILLSGPLSAAEEKGNVLNQKTYPLVQLQKDFDQLMSVIALSHPKLYTDQNELEKLKTKQYRSLKNDLSELEFFRLLAPIVSKLNCGHTRLQLSPELDGEMSQKPLYLPLRIKFIQNRAFVWLNAGNREIPAGSEILAINGRPTAEIVDILLNDMTADGSNLSKKYYELNHWFSELYAAYIDNPGQFVIRFIKPGAEKAGEIELKPVLKGKLIAAEPVTDWDLSPYTQKFEKNRAVMKIETFAFYDAVRRDQLKEFIDRFFRKVRDEKIENLILDLRDNWGGDPYCSAYLFQYLIRQPSPYFATDSPFYDDLKTSLKPAENRFQGNLYILINGASFSSTGHLCSLLKHHHIGTFIGDETGGSYVCTDGSKDVMLNNTKIRFHYSTMAFKTAVSGLTPGRGIMPDYTIVPTIDDYIAGKDVEMDFTVGLIQKNDSAK